MLCGEPPRSTEGSPSTLSNSRVVLKRPNGELQRQLVGVLEGLDGSRSEATLSLGSVVSRDE